MYGLPPIHQTRMFSVASGRGLIEAPTQSAASSACRRFPWHRAAASLKHNGDVDEQLLFCRFPWHRAAASLKPFDEQVVARLAGGFPWHRAAASLKRTGKTRASVTSAGFPWHRAAASLKPLRVGLQVVQVRVRFPWHRAAASLKPGSVLAATSRLMFPVFRGIGPRPH